MNLKNRKETEDMLYQKIVKRCMDFILATIGIIVLAIPMGTIAIIIKLTDPGPVLFKQKRVGIHKKNFELYKFRTMHVSAPKDCPTHLLESPEQYITKIGRFLRKSSLDELPQLFNIWKGQMSIIGPRPALWNQEDLIVEREKYGANDIVPGLTGLAQIRGRDELEIPLKAQYDGEYAAILNRGFFSAIAIDGKCFFETIVSVLKQEGVMEGGTGKKKRML